MKLDRNITEPPRGKYALIKLRHHTPFIESSVQGHILVNKEAIDFGDTEDSEFFVIRLKDKYAMAALLAYAEEAVQDDKEYSKEVHALAIKACNHPNKHKPD